MGERLHPPLIVLPINHPRFEEAVLRALQMLFILFRSLKILKRGTCDSAE